MPTITRIFTLLLLFSGLQAVAQNNGWERIRQNDFVAARSAFEQELKAQPNNTSALAGLIFLAETLQDPELFEKNANQLLQGDDPHLIWLFGQMYDKAPEEMLKRKLPTDVKLPFMAQQADTLFRYRKFAESAAMLNSMVPDWNWMIAGPFDNVAGSAFVEKDAPETQPFNPNATFKNAADTEFSWLKRSLRAPGEPVGFGSLPRHSGMATFYANTFITLPAARQVSLNLTRGEPIKVWIDDQLVYADARLAAPGEWDQESISLNLSAGTHRILVKIAEFPEYGAESKLRLRYNDSSNDGDEEESDGYRNALSAGDAWSGRANGTNFILRLCDPATGNLLSDIQSDYQANYKPATKAWESKVSVRSHLNHFMKMVEEDPSDWSRQYFLARAFAKYKLPEDGEAYFAKQYAGNEGSYFHKFLLAKFYNSNDKDERAEALLSEMDTLKAPTFAEHFLRLNKLNVEQQESEFLSGMERIMSFAPSNWQIMGRYLEFLKEKGRKEQIQSFVRGFLNSHDTPKWKDRLEEYLEDESYKPESYKPMTDKEREKNFKNVKKRMKTMFRYYDYSRAIDYYKTKEQINEALKLYDEVLAITPYSSTWKYNKANFLFEKERLDEALVLLQQLREHEPYDADVLEMMGDIYIEKKNNTEALKWYRLAEKQSPQGAIGEKIEKLENKKRYNGYFPAINLVEVAKDRSWAAQYTDEDAVISHYSMQAVYLPDDKKVESTNRLVIHILNDAGAKRWTEADLRQIGNITGAKVLKKDGSVTSPDLGWGVAVFKNLQAGDIILIEGVNENTMPDEIPGEFLDLSIFTWQSPVAHASLELLMPKAQEVYLSCNRLDCNYTRSDTAGFKRLHWNWRDIAKYQGEEAAPDNYDNYAWMMMGSVKDWSKVVQWYERKTYCRTEPNYEILAAARALVRPGMSEDAIVETFHTFITQEINYSYVPFLNSNYVPKKAGATLSSKVGDCKDVATLMITLLREQGIQAWYTLVSTHNFSNREPRPTPYVFNHAIVAYQLKDGKLRFADLTTDYFPTGVLPEGDCNAWGLVIREGENALRRLPNDSQDPAISRAEINAKAVLQADGSLSLDVKTVRHGTNAGHWREGLLRATVEERNKQLSEYFGGGVLHHLSLDEVQYHNLEDINDPLRIDVRMTAFNQLDRVSNLYIMPLPLPVSMPTQKALFAARRYNDLDLDALLELAPVRENVALTLPAGFELAELPQTQKIENEFGTYVLSFEKTAAGLNIRREVTLKKRFIPFDQFGAFKRFYLDMLDADDALLALRKKA